MIKGSNKVLHVLLWCVSVLSAILAAIRIFVLLNQIGYIHHVFFCVLWPPTDQYAPIMTLLFLSIVYTTDIDLIILVLLRSLLRITWFLIASVGLNTSVFA
jgi:hypothetical protein